MIRLSTLLTHATALFVAAPLALGGLSNATTTKTESMNAETAERFSRLALDCVEQEYPNLIHHVLAGDDDVAPPRELTPSFYGCYDWHSAVHGHWLASFAVYLETRRGIDRID